MALSRRANNRMAGNTWPGFVDAMTSLLMVVTFVLTVFVIIMSMLRETISGQENELSGLSAELNALALQLGLEQQRSFGLEEQLANLNATLDASREEGRVQAALIASLQADAVDTAARIASFEEQVASLLADRDAATTQIATLEGEKTELLSAQEALNLAIAKARDEIDAAAEAARLAAAQREAMEALIAQAKAEAAAQSLSLSQALAALDAAKASETTLAAALDAANAGTAADRAALAAAEADLAAKLAQLDAAEAARLLEAAAAQALRDRLADVESAMTEDEQKRLAEAAAAEALRARLENADAELTAMTLALEEQRRKAEETLTLLAAAQTAQAVSETAAAEALTEAQKRAALLAVAEKALATETEKSTQAQREVALLNQQLIELRTQLNVLQSTLDASAGRDDQTQVQIETLSFRLNAALARAAIEERKRAALEEAERVRLEEETKRLAAEAKQLERYRSEFFGKLRELLGEREGVRIVGDRFVFSSEVLFEPGSADLAPEGQAQISRVAAILDEISGDIPPEIDWVIRVDGHTDRTPMGTGGAFADNWELSQARALSVVRFMIDQLGFDATRLAATGFGEFQPINRGGSASDLAQNRRIELKLTEK